ncbi:MAG: VanZ family protein [Candidatus Scalindua sp.]
MRKLILCFYVLYVLLIAYFSLIPIEHEIFKGIGDKWSHFIAYLILFIIAKKVHTNYNYLTCAIACFIYSFIIECIQFFVPNRYFEGLDLLANSSGIFLGMVIYRLLIEQYFEIKQNAI